MRKLTVMLAAAAVLVAIPAQAAQASHANPDPFKHLHNMHYQSVEQFCVQSFDTAKVSHSSARSFVNQTLTQMGSGKVWDGLGSGRLQLHVTNNYCSAYDPTTRATIEIEVYYGWDWSGVCGAPVGYYNCVVHDNPVFDSARNHWDARWAYVYLVFSSGGRLDNVGRAFINHEFGHVWGLADHGVGSSSCNPPSIMHSTVVSYPCTNWPYWYPSPSDFQSVLRIME
ncbi:MAG TPA: hypothetical protein VFC19_24835 [Candidatus Limnocylindrales bacterium]|nr:hypothetical protein [Candidatus Limnocylindrales bacterium]